MELSNPQHGAKVLSLVDQYRIMEAVERMTIIAEHPATEFRTMTQRAAYTKIAMALMWAINQPSDFEAFMAATDETMAKLRPASARQTTPGIQ